MLIVGITQEPCTRNYYLIFRHEIRPVLDKIIRRYGYIQYLEYDDFDELREIGSGNYKTVYTAKYKKYLAQHIPETVVLKRFKNFDQALDLFISEVSIFYMPITNYNMVFDPTLYLFIHLLNLIGQQLCQDFELSFSSNLWNDAQPRNRRLHASHAICQQW